MEIIRFKNAKVTNWSGGETHEILIYPHGSNFKENNYDLRISVATVNLESTVFTSLPGVKRILTVLEGNLKLTHEGQHESHLQPYRQDSFLGDWKTRSKGKVRDFNVMWNPGQATVKHRSYAPNSSFSLEAKNEQSICFLAKGSFTANNETIHANDTVVMNGALEIRTNEQCEILVVSYNY